MPDLTPFKAVFFDLGGTLFHHLPKSFTHENVLHSIGRVTATLPASEAHILQCYDQLRHQIDQEFTSMAFFMHRRLVADAFARTLTAFELPVPREVVSAFCDRQGEHVTQQLRLRTDALQTLSTLRSKGIFVGVVSNIDDDYIVPLLQRTELPHHLDWWISSERARSCKPHAGIFLQALAAAHTAAEQVLYVGDSYPHDVVGATRLSMHTALLTIDHQVPAPAGADHTISHLAEILSLED